MCPVICVFLKISGRKVTAHTSNPPYWPLTLTLAVPIVLIVYSSRPNQPSQDCLPQRPQDRPMSRALPVLCANWTCFKCVLSFKNTHTHTHTHTHTVQAWEPTQWAQIPPVKLRNCLCLPISCQLEGRICPYSSQKSGWSLQLPRCNFIGPQLLRISFHVAVFLCWFLMKHTFFISYISVRYPPPCFSLCFCLHFYLYNFFFYFLFFKYLLCSNQVWGICLNPFSKLF